MELVYKGTKLHYQRQGKGEHCLLFLHGWGGNINSFMALGNILGDTTKIYVDFPPFGNSEEPKSPWTLEDYSLSVLSILQQEQIKSCDIISHSFGTRVAILICNSYTVKVKKLIITGGAGLKPKRRPKYYLTVFKNKTIRLFNKKINLGSKDYQKLSPVMKKTFSAIVTTYLEKQAKQINCPTLLIYGRNDTETPLYMAKRFNKLIKNSAIIVFEKSGHFAYIENLYKFAKIVKTFLKEK